MASLLLAPFLGGLTKYNVGEQRPFRLVWSGRLPMGAHDLEKLISVLLQLD